MKILVLGVALVLAGTSDVRVSTAQPEARSVRMLIGFSTGTEKRTAQVVVREGEAGMLEVPSLGKFAFTPTARKDDTTAFDIAVDDVSLSPPAHLTTTTVKADAPPVDTGTKPAFQLAIRLPPAAK